MLLPVGDDSGRLIGLVKLEDIDTLHAEEEIKHNTQVLIMAGGFGKD